MSIDVHVEVDPDRCIGSGLCEAVAPATFVVEDGLARVTDDRDPDDDLVEARDRCPTTAIAVTRDGTPL